MNQDRQNNNNGTNLVRTNAIHPQPILTVTVHLNGGQNEQSHKNNK
jgi:hypothetical protein